MMTYGMDPKGNGRGADNQERQQAAKLIQSRLMQLEAEARGMNLDFVALLIGTAALSCSDVAGVQVASPRERQALQ